MIKSGDQFRITKYDHTPEDFLEWMNQKTTRDVKVFRTSHEKLSVSVNDRLLLITLENVLSF